MFFSSELGEAMKALRFFTRRKVPKPTEKEHTMLASNEGGFALQRRTGVGEVEVAIHLGGVEMRRQPRFASLGEKRLRRARRMIFILDNVYNYKYP